MKKIVCAVSCWFVVLACLFLSASATAQPTMSLPPTQSPLLISIQALVGPNNAPAAAETPPADNNASDENIEPQETLGTKTLSKFIAGLETLQIKVQTFVSEFAALPEMAAWFDRQSSNPRYAAYWAAIGHDLVYAVAVSLVSALLLELLLMPARQNLRRRKPHHFSGRLVTALIMFGLKFLSVLLFISMSLAIMEKSQDARVVRFFVLSVVYAIAVSRLVAMISRFLLSPRAAPLRLLPSTAIQALYIHRWVCGFSGVITVGYFVVDAANAVHVPGAAITAFGNVLGFILVAMTIVVITQKRAYVSARLRGDLSVAHRDLSLWQSSRLWFARRWHVLAILYLVVGYLITAFGIPDGFALMLRGTILTLLILALMRLLFHAVNRWGATDAAEGFHHAALRFLFRLVIWGAAIVAAAAGWGADIPALVATPFGLRIMNAGFSIGITIVTVTLIYEVFGVLIERYLNRRDETGVVQASARARTLLPMIRNTAFIIFTMIVGLVTLSAAGVNIAPLLAGAGVIGVAVGFGSQTLVKDFMTGLFIVLENVIAVGDFVKIGEFSGIVETISVRTIRLRDENGSLHVMPFSEVTKITNMARDGSYAMFDVGVAYGSDLDHVMDSIRAVGKKLQTEPAIGPWILESVEILGIENLGDFSVTVRSRVRIQPGMQREVRRMFLLRIKQRFDKEGIVIPFPTVTYVKQEVGPLAPVKGSR